MRLLLVAIAVLCVAGCGGDDESTSPPVTTAESATGCTQATTHVMTPLANKLTLEGARLTNSIWATTSPHGAEAIYSLNDLAKQYSDWRNADAIDVSADDAGATAARLCVFR